MSMSGDEHWCYFDDVAMGATLVVVTRTLDNGDLGKSRVRYKLRGVPKTFVTEDDLIDAWESRMQGGYADAGWCPRCGAEVLSVAKDED